MTKKSTDNENDLATVGSYWNATEAWLTRNRLADEGIDAFVIDDLTVSTNWLYANAIGGVKVQVPRSQLPLAREVLARGNSDAFAHAPTRPSETDNDAEAARAVCPECGSHEVYRKRFAIRAIFAFWLILGFPVPIWTSEMRCFNCGAQFNRASSARPKGRLRPFLVAVLAIALLAGIVWLTGQAWFEAASGPNFDSR